MSYKQRDAVRLIRFRLVRVLFRRRVVRLLWLFIRKVGNFRPAYDRLLMAYQFQLENDLYHHRNSEQRHEQNDQNSSPNAPCEPDPKLLHHGSSCYSVLLVPI